MIQEGALVCGIDEAGRGSLAGPVCAAAVILPKKFDFSLLDDSKKMSEKRRLAAARAIYKSATAWGIGWATNEEIDSANILKATLLAMARAYEGAAKMLALRLSLLPGEAARRVEAVVDGPFAPSLDCASCRAVVKADSSVHEVMAASIIAKTARDETMRRYAELYPGYGYERHKGYGTREHAAALERLGPSPIQRRTFKLKGSGVSGINA